MTDSRVNWTLLKDVNNCSRFAKELLLTALKNEYIVKKRSRVLLSGMNYELKDEQHV